MPRFEGALIVEPTRRRAATTRQAARLEEESVSEGLVHLPVLPRETLELLAPAPGDTVVDATVGRGGHTEELLRAVGSAGRVLGIDRDPEALARSSSRLARFGSTFTAIHGDHTELVRLLQEHQVERVDRILFDLGISSAQLDDPLRGFSFAADGPLDMRMDQETGPTAADLLADLPEGELVRILWRFGEERRSRAIARAIVGERERRPVERTTQLADLVVRVAGPAARRFRIHPATRTFQALRIAVNCELVDLPTTVEDAVSLLSPGGRIAVISFHSLEDRPVKHTLRSLVNRCVCPPALPICGCGRTSLIRILTSRPVRPSDEEIERNPRSRSARLRVAEKL
jgi:16S rRNA (cytosine1402-N4)-methyltransferase